MTNGRDEKGDSRSRKGREGGRPARMVVLFHTTNHAFRAESLVCAAGFPADLVPVPRELSSDCGVCLRIRQADRDKVVAILGANHVEIVGIHDLPG